MDVVELRAKLDVLLSVTTAEAVGSKLLIDLIKVHRALINNGNSQVLHCEKCYRKFHEDLLRIGNLKFEQMKKIFEKTNVAKLKGLKFVRMPDGVGRHFFWEQMPDDLVCELLDNGILQEDDFEKLPIMYKSKVSVKTNTESLPDIQAENIVNKQSPQHRPRKNKKKY